MKASFLSVRALLALSGGVIGSVGCEAESSGAGPVTTVVQNPAVPGAGEAPAGHSGGAPGGDPIAGGTTMMDAVSTRADSQGGMVPEAADATGATLAVPDSPAMDGAEAAGGSAQPDEATASGTDAPGGSTDDRGPGAPGEAEPMAELPEQLTLWLAGDSTVARGVTPCPTGWGAKVGDFFSERVTVENLAAGGASVASWAYRTQSSVDGSGECQRELGADGLPLPSDRYQRLLDGLHAGDYLLVQFGINDGSPTCPRHVGLSAFKELYGELATLARERGAQPVFLTPVSAVKCRGTEALPTRGSYVDVTLEAGLAFEVPVIDLHQRSIEYYQERGFCPLPGGQSDVSAATTGAVGEFFCDDHTHFSPAGAEGIAGLVVQALRDQGIGLAQYSN